MTATALEKERHQPAQPRRPRVIGGDSGWLVSPAMRGRSGSCPVARPLGAQVGAVEGEAQPISWGRGSRPVLLGGVDGLEDDRWAITPGVPARSEPCHR